MMIVQEIGAQIGCEGALEDSGQACKRLPDSAVAGVAGVWTTCLAHPWTLQGMGNAFALSFLWAVNAGLTTLIFARNGWVTTCLAVGVACPLPCFLDLTNWGHDSGNLQVLCCCLYIFFSFYPVYISLLSTAAGGALPPLYVFPSGLAYHGACCAAEAQVIKQGSSYAEAEALLCQGSIT
eukprot:1156350-Pelagomonas_calceolata.AAC.8